MGNSKIIDKRNIDSEIKAKNLYVGIMPLRSLIQQKWILKIRPEQTEINIYKDFFKRDKSNQNTQSTNKSKFKYDLIFDLNKYSTINLKNSESNIKVKLKGNVIYKSNNSQTLAKLISNFDGRGFLKFKFNKNLNQDFLRIELYSKGLDLENSEYSFGSRKINFEDGNFKSKFKFYKSSSETFCKGRFSFTNLKIKSEGLSENVNSDLTTFFCKDNNLIGIQKISIMEL